MKSEMRVLLVLLITVCQADKKFQWKMIKSNVHDRLTQFGTISVCGIAKGVEPLYPGELRAHNCDLLQCRKTVSGLEEWICEGCVRGTPECVDFERKKLSRQNDRARRSHERSIVRSRKIRYRKMKRAALLAERKQKRAERLAAKKAKKEARALRKKERNGRRSQRGKKN